MKGTHEARHTSTTPPSRKLPIAIGLSPRARPRRTMAIAAARTTTPRIARKSEIVSTRAGSEKSAMNPDAGMSGSSTDSALRRKTIGANSAAKDEAITKEAPTLPRGPARWSHGLDAGSGGAGLAALRALLRAFRNDHVWV